MKDLFSLLNGLLNTDVDLTPRWFATWFFNTCADELMMMLWSKSEMEPPPTPSPIMKMEPEPPTMMVNSHTECTRATNHTKTARPEIETRDYTLLTEKNKEDLLMEELVPFTLDKTTTDNDLLMNVLKKEIIILTGILLNGEILPSWLTPRITVNSIKPNLKTSRPKDTAKTPKTLESTLLPTIPLNANLLPTNGLKLLLTELMLLIALKSHGPEKTT
jgi:hypothetical protein